MALVLLLLGAVAISLKGSIYPRDQWLQHVGTPIVIWVLLVEARRLRISNMAFVCLIAFYLMHVLGARYVYSMVPGGEELNWLSLGGEGVGRNHYDRLTHLAFGALTMPAMVELAQKRLGLWWSRLVAMGIVLAISGAYEIFEWLLAVIADPAHADRYNGQQGDMWDAQKDMLLAWIGSVLFLPVTGLRARSDA